ncbi:MAG TPA: biotin/lipoyl-containing protein [Pyrinomonadaceae bacterium]|nr:biotin/lipoyl-containing protein [Pyrinomonadaceae bacterium]
MKIQAQIGDETYQVKIKRDGDRVFATINDREYELEASQPEPNIFLLKHNGRVHEIFVSPNTSASEPYSVSIGRKDIDVRLIDPKKLRGAGNAAEHGDGLAEIKTMMPGKVVRLLLNVGDVVEKGDAVMVVEAMKMQNDLKSPKDGTVKEIRVEEGSTVGAGDVLAIVE